MVFAQKILFAIAISLARTTGLKGESTEATFSKILGTHGGSEQISSQKRGVCNNGVCINET